MERKRNRALFWIIIFFLIIISIFTIIKLSSDNIILSAELSEDDWVKGNTESSIVLIEYSDFQCPACVNYFNIVKEIMDEFGGHIQYAYRHFPLRSIHQNAQLAAQAAEAAGKQDAFWEMHDMLFKNQDQWANESTDDAEEIFISYAEQLELDTDQFEKDLKSKQVKKAVDIEFDSAMEGNLSGTPTFFLNGEKINNPRNLEEFRTLIRNAIQNTT